MKKFSVLLSIVVSLAIIGCSTAGQTKTPEKAPEQKPISQKDLTDNISKRIAEYDKPIAEAKKALEASPAWQQFLKDKEFYQEALTAFQEGPLKTFKEQDKKAAELQEFKTLNYLIGRQNELKKLLEGGK